MVVKHQLAIVYVTLLTKTFLIFSASKLPWVCAQTVCGYWLVIICDSYVASVLYIEGIKYFIVLNHDNYPNNEFITKTLTM